MLVNPLGRPGVPSGNVVPFQTMEGPSRFAEYAEFVPAKPPVPKLIPSLKMALTRNEVETGGITMPVFTVAVALSCVALNGVP